MLAAFTHEVSKMPFIGRHIVKRAANWSMRERYTGPKIAKTIGGVALVGGLAVGHLYQARLGQEAFFHNAAEFAAGDESFLRRAEVAYDAAYAGANVAVSVAQTYVSARMVKSLGRTLCKPARTRPYEVGIAPPESAPKNVCEPYEVGIETAPNQAVTDTDPASRQTWKEWRQENAQAIRFYTDVGVTLAAQLLISS